MSRLVRSSVTGRSWRARRCLDLPGGARQLPVEGEGAAQGGGAGVGSDESVPDAVRDAPPAGARGEEEAQVGGFVAGEDLLGEAGDRVEPEPPRRPGREEVLAAGQRAQQRLHHDQAADPVRVPQGEQAAGGVPASMPTTVADGSPRASRMPSAGPGR
ncbi:hypothetical protein [Amycolatopsis methanolica]